MLQLLHKIIFPEGKVVCVERKTVLKPDQAEFVLSEGNMNAFFLFLKLQFVLPKRIVLIIPFFNFVIFLP